MGYQPPNQMPGGYPGQYPQQQQGYGQPQQGYGQPQQQQYQQQPPQQQMVPAGPPMPAGVPPKAQEALALVNMLPGEQVVYAIQADGFFVGTNPAAKAIAALQATLVKLTGGHIRVFLVLTNQRVMMLESRSIYCGCFGSKGVHTMALSSLSSAGSAKATQYCFFHSRFIHLESKTQHYGMVVKSMDDNQVKEFVSNLGAVIVANASSRTAT